MFTDRMNNMMVPPPVSEASTGNNHGMNKFENKWYTQQSDSLLGMASSSLFSMDSFTRTLFPQTTLDGVQQPASQGPRVRPEDIASQVLEELSDDFFNDDIFDTAALEPVPIDTSRMKVVERLPINHSQTQHAWSSTLSSLAQMNPEPAVSMSAQELRKRELESIFMEDLPLKKQRLEEEEDAKRFRVYQAEQWTEKFGELIAFRETNGHCCVPHTYKENPALARWVKRQRYQYKLKNENKQSTMTDERIVALENIGFIWDSHGAAWQERLSELREYWSLNGHCNVPSNFPPNPQLATWVKCQRRQYKLFWSGKTSNMTKERVAQLEKLGFEWELRGSNKSMKVSAI